MKIFVFQRIDQVSDNYHTEGGLVVIAKSKIHAKEILKQDNDIEITDDEWDSVKSFNLAGKKTKPQFWVMCDAGCC